MSSQSLHVYGRISTWFRTGSGIFRRRVEQPLLAFVFPNLPCALLVVIGLAAETALLAYRSDSIYATRGLSIPAVVALLCAYWLTAGWVLRGLTQAALRVTRSWPLPLSIAVRTAVVLGLAAVLGLYLVSWALYFQAGSFLSYEGIEFFLTNVGEVWRHVAMTRQSDLWLVGLASALVLIGAPFYLAWLARASWSGLDTPKQRSLRRVAWYIVLIAAVALTLPGLWAGGFLQPSMILDALEHRLNPGVTLFASSVEALADEPIEACLDTSQLRPLQGASYRTPPASPRTRPSVLIIAIESMRHDVVLLSHQGQEVMPNYNALARQGLILPHTYCASTHSDYADPPIVSSLYPLWTRRHHYYKADDPWPRTRLYDLFKPEGYATALISSENEEWGGKSKFYASPGLDLIEDAERSTASSRKMIDSSEAGEIKSGVMRSGSLDDVHTANAAIAWITQQTAANRPFFLYINFQDSHFPYDLPPNAARPFQPCDWSPEGSFLSFPPEQIERIRNSYYNALHEVDRQIGRVVETLRKDGRLENTILILTGDNGEAFNEGGRAGHAGDPFEPEVHISCILHAPGRLKPKVDDYPVSHVDLPPTILGLMDWPPHPNFQGIDVLAADRPPAAERVLYSHTETPISRTDAALLAGRWKYLHQRRTGTELLFDLGSDPEETDNLAGSNPEMFARMRALVALWRKRQLAYYHHPIYYRNYYPPAVPGIRDVE